MGVSACMWVSVCESCHPPGFCTSWKRSRPSQASWRVCQASCRCWEVPMGLRSFSGNHVTMTREIGPDNCGFNGHREAFSLLAARGAFPEMRPVFIWFIRRVRLHLPFFLRKVNQCVLTMWSHSSPCVCRLVDGTTARGGFTEGIVPLRRAPWGSCLWHSTHVYGCIQRFIKKKDFFLVIPVCVHSLLLST